MTGREEKKEKKKRKLSHEWPRGRCGAVSSYPVCLRCSVGEHIQTPGPGPPLKPRGAGTSGGAIVPPSSEEAQTYLSEPWCAPTMRNTPPPSLGSPLVSVLDRLRPPSSPPMLRPTVSLFFASIFSVWIPTRFNWCAISANRDQRARYPLLALSSLFFNLCVFALFPFSE